MKYYIRNNILRQNMKVDTDFSLLHKIMHYKVSEETSQLKVIDVSKLLIIFKVMLKVLKMKERPTS